MIFAQQAVHIVREPPFNVLQAHWPVNTLCQARDRCLGHLRSLWSRELELSSVVAGSNTVDERASVLSSNFSYSKQNNSESENTQNLVLYLWRPKGKRWVSGQASLVGAIRRALRPGLQLVVRSVSRVALHSHWLLWIRYIVYDIPPFLPPFLPPFSLPPFWLLLVAKVLGRGAGRTAGSGTGAEPSFVTLGGAVGLHRQQWMDSARLFSRARAVIGKEVLCMQLMPYNG